MLPSIVWISVLDWRMGVKVSKHINGLNKEKFKAHTLKIRRKYYEKESARKKDSTYNHLQYKKGIKFGPLFVCVCCHAGLFQKSVKIFTEKMKQSIDSKTLESSCIFSEEFMDPLEEGNFYVCHNCYTVMKKNKMPKASVKNNLYVDKIPPELQLSDLENQCIARNIIFMKMKELPKTRMKKIW